MKFLVIARPRQNQQGMTSAMVEASKEIANRYLKSGIDDCLFAIADGIGGSCGIMNADSGEALVELLQNVPAVPFMEVQTYLLADFNKVVDKLIEGMKKQRL
jgi:hypothetical protein